MPQLPINVLAAKGPASTAHNRSSDKGQRSGCTIVWKHHYFMVVVEYPVGLKLLFPDVDLLAISIKDIWFYAMEASSLCCWGSHNLYWNYWLGCWLSNWWWCDWFFFLNV